MATRMQQRRGTAAQWTAANPILAAGEIGFETDTNKFKMGNGSSTWSALVYFSNNAALTELLDGAPEALDTLNELAAAMGDNADFLSALATKEELDAAIDAAAVIVNNGFASIQTDFNNHASQTISVHGIADTSVLVVQDDIADFVTQSELTNAIDTATVDQSALAGIGLNWNGDDERFDIKEGLAGDGLVWNSVTEAFDLDSTIASKEYVDQAQANATTEAEDTAEQALLAHSSDTTEVHGIADTALLATMSYADQAEADAITAAGTAADTKISTHNSDTTDVHGIADTSALATKTYADSAVTTAVAALTKSSVGLGNVDNTSDADKPVSTATQDALDLKSPLADPTFTGTVSGVTKTMVGLGNVDNTSDADKPVSTATQTALDAKASLAGAVFTGNVEVDGNLVVDGDFTVNGTNFSASATSITIEDNMLQLAHQNPANTVDIGLVVGYNDGANKHAGLVRDVSDAKWKLFKGVTTGPTTTVDFTEGSLDDLKVAAFEATTVTASSGIVFSDGTQTKLGVPSVTTFATEISSSATLAAGEADKFVPLTGAVTITLPATGYSTGQSIDFYQASGTGAQFSNANSTVGTPGLKFRTTNSVVTAMKTPSGWLVFGDLSA